MYYSKEKAILFNFLGYYSKFSGVQNFTIFTVYEKTIKLPLKYTYQ